MSRGENIITVEELLANAGWVRAVARGLLGDEHTTEDAVQDTWLAALESGPRDPSKLGAWLDAGGVAPLPEAAVPDDVARIRGRVWVRGGGSLSGHRVFVWGGDQPGDTIQPIPESPWTSVSSMRRGNRFPRSASPCGGKTITPRRARSSPERTSLVVCA